MALYEMTESTLNAIDPTSFTQLKLLERQDIQKVIKKHIAAITPNIKTMVIAEEFGDWVGVNRRIDLLCIDDQANLVVVELKRDDASHMELQALRYAAMISTMRFDQAVEAHRKYLLKSGSEEDPAQAIREFLDKDEGEVVAFSDKVRIVLASAEFSAEITTSVLWLNKQGLDIRCVQMRPHQIGNRVLLDIQQVIPLPQVEQYQIAVREKSIEQETARKQGKDTTRYDFIVGEKILPNLSKRKLILSVIREAFQQNVAVSEIEKAVIWRGNLFISTAGTLNEAQFLQIFESRNRRYFTADSELFHIDGRTFALSKMWGERTLDAVDNVLERMPQAEDIRYFPTSGIAEEVAYADLILRCREGGTIEVEKNGVQVSPVIPVLRELAAMLQVQQVGLSGNALNTRRLGIAVMNAIRSI